jgi:hypothetical protein
MIESKLAIEGETAGALFLAISCLNFHSLLHIGHLG